MTAMKKELLWTTGTELWVVDVGSVVVSGAERERNP